MEKKDWSVENVSRSRAFLAPKTQNNHEMCKLLQTVNLGEGTGTTCEKSSMNDIVVGDGKEQVDQDLKEVNQKKDSEANGKRANEKLANHSERQKRTSVRRRMKAEMKSKPPPRTSSLRRCLITRSTGVEYISTTRRANHHTKFVGMVSEQTTIHGNQPDNYHEVRFGLIVDRRNGPSWTRSIQQTTKSEMKSQVLVTT